MVSGMSPSTSPRSWTNNNKLRRSASSIHGYQGSVQPTASVDMEWRRALGHSISINTIYCRINSPGLHAYHSNRRVPLSPQQRLLHCRGAKKGDSGWRNGIIMVFSDESRFCLWLNDGRIRIRRYCGERPNFQFALRGHTGQTLGVMVQGAVCLAGYTRTWMS
jgi:hypothetical protein